MINKHASVPRILLCVGCRLQVRASSEGMEDAVSKIEGFIKLYLKRMSLSFNLFGRGGTEVCGLFSDFGKGAFLAPSVIALAMSLASMPRSKLETLDFDAILREHCDAKIPHNRRFEVCSYAILLAVADGNHHALRELSLGLVSACHLHIRNTSTPAPIRFGRKHPP